MRNGSEIEPGQNRIANQIDFRVSLHVIPLAHPLHFDGSLIHELFDAFSKTVMSESDGPIRTCYCASAVDLFVAPDLTVDNACPEILNLVRGDE